MQISINFTAGAGCETFRTSKSFFKKEEVWIPEFSALRSSVGTLTIHIRFTIQTINPHLQKPKTAFKPLLPAFGVGFLKLSSFASCSFVVELPPWFAPPKFLHHHQVPLKRPHLPDFVLSSPFGGKGLCFVGWFFLLVSSWQPRLIVHHLEENYGMAIVWNCHAPLPKTSQLAAENGWLGRRSFHFGIRPIFMANCSRFREAMSLGSCMSKH